MPPGAWSWLVEAVAGDDGSGEGMFPGPARVAWGRVNGMAGTAGVENVRAWRAWRLVPHAFRDVTRIDCALRIFGEEWAAPVIAAPWAAQRTVHPDGETATARGVRAAGLGLGLSSSSSEAIAAVGGAAGSFLQQLYLPADRSAALPFVESARRAGAWGLALTTDAPSNAIDAPFRSTEPVASRDWPTGVPLGGAPDLALADIAWLRERSGLPVLCKGILRPSDAVAAVEAGADGIIVSNHGGRQLAGGLPTALALGPIVEALEGRVPVIVDSGIRSPEDVVRALALGADAVMLGRPIAWALAAGGEAAVGGFLLAFVDELRATMARLGVASLSDIGADLLVAA